MTDLPKTETLLLERDAAPSETVDLPPALPGGLPTFLGLGREGGIAPDRLSRAVTVEIPFPGPDLRARIWRAALGDRPVTDLPALRDRFQLPHGHIRRLAAAAAGEARLEGRDAIAPDDVRRAARQLGRQELDGLADPLEARGRWDDLVASPAATTLLQELAARARHREALPDRLSERPGRGLRALLTGPSGAGKTLAARIFAAELGMDIHRVDLASVVSKFVGETEKNLARLLARAEALDVVLLIDEGDALLARRTEVKSSNDRFANMETDFLLQRLEFHQGVVLITTNLAESVDPAFQRRMDAVIPFARPGAKLDVTCSSAGDASSLTGGTLLRVPLEGADSKVYAVAQGPVSLALSGEEGSATLRFSVCFSMLLAVLCVCVCVCVSVSVCVCEPCAQTQACLCLSGCLAASLSRRLSPRCYFAHATAQIRAGKERAP